MYVILSSIWYLVGLNLNHEAVCRDRRGVGQSFLSSTESKSVMQGTTKARISLLEASLILSFTVTPAKRRTSCALSKIACQVGKGRDEGREVGVQRGISKSAAQASDRFGLLPHCNKKPAPPAPPALLVVVSLQVLRRRLPSPYLLRGVQRCATLAVLRALARSELQQCLQHFAGALLRRVMQCRHAAAVCAVHRCARHHEQLDAHRRLW